MHEDLKKRIIEGDGNARNEYLTANLALISKMVRDSGARSSRHFPFADMVSEARLVAIRCLNVYDGRVNLENSIRVAIKNRLWAIIKDKRDNPYQDLASHAIDTEVTKLEWLPDPSTISTETSNDLIPKADNVVDMTECVTFRQRRIILAKCVRSKTIPEIAKEMGLAEPTVRREWNQGLLKIRQFYEGLQYESLEAIREREHSED